MKMRRIITLVHVVEKMKKAQRRDFTEEKGSSKDPECKMQTAVFSGMAIGSRVGGYQLAEEHDVSNSGRGGITSLETLLTT
jgi:hypothetical protein